MNRRAVFCVWFAAVACIPLSARETAYNVQENIEYCREPVSLKLDAHVPPGKGPFPAIILVHGGGWTAGSKTANFVLPLFGPLDQTGYTWFTIDYRLAPEYPYLAALEDVEKAISFVKQHASEYKVNPKKIVLMGESAGAHLVNVIGARNRPPNDVAAVVSFYGPIDMVEFSKKFEGKPPTGGMKDFFQIPDWSDQSMAKIREASPATYLGRKTPPFLFIHGTNDQAVPYEQSTRAIALFKSLGIPCDLITVEDGVHGVINWEKDPKFQNYKPAMITWLHKYLGTPQQ
jgi:acetyl esterase/lipase